METRHHRFWHTAREFLTHWTVAGAILAVTGAAPEHWFADLAHKLPLPFENMPPWLGHLDYRLVALIAGLSIIVGDTLWRHHGAVRSHMPEPAVAIPATEAARADVLPLPDKPSIAVLPFTNLSGDLAQEYFSDGITDDIITELSRFRALFVIASSSTFTYKGKPTDVRQVARELGVRYVLEGSARKSGNHARVSAKLVDAVSGSQLWAEHYDRTLDDVFALQEDVTRGIVTAVAPEVELAEMAHARHGNANDNALHLIWRAQGMMHEGVRRGDASLVLDAIAKARQAIAADPASLAAYNILAWSHWSCHLYRWGPEPAKALDAMSSAIEQMQRIDALDHRTLTICGVVRVVRGEQERGLVDLRRAIEVNPNSSLSLMWLALCEAMGGSAEDARTHANLSLRLNPRDFWIGVAHLALAMVGFLARDYAEATHWAELSIQSEPSAPFRRTIMIASSAQNGDTERAARELATLNGFAPEFIPSLFRGEVGVFRRPDDVAHLLEGLRLAGASG
jgi:adenylate cyclase